MRHYEVAVVLHPDLEIDLDRAASKVETIIVGLGGKIEKKDNWGKRKLAYKLKKQDWGIYVFYQIMIDPAQIQPLDNTLRITDEVMRYLVVSLEDIKTIMKPKSDPRATKPGQSGAAAARSNKPVPKPKTQDTDADAPDSDK